MENAFLKFEHKGTFFMWFDNEVLWLNCLFY